MKSILKRLCSISIMFAVLFCAGISFVGCKKNNQQVYGDFLYSVAYYDEDGNRVIKEKGVRSGIMIMGLSEVGKEKEIVVLPEYINGLKVEQLGYEKMWGSEGCWKSEKLKKVFVPFPPVMIEGVFSGCVNLEKIIFLVHDADVYYLIGSNYIPKYITSYHYIKEEYTTNFFEFHGGNYYFSNVSFMFNCDNAPNDNYYWTDDCDYGGRIEYIPEQPVRDGYSFGGWYKEPECVSEWNFEIDTLPQAQYTEDNEEIYQETKLYAKWIKK